GSFDFGARRNAAAPQVWIAGGIGLTPFLAKLDERASQPTPAADTDLFYCTRSAVAFPDRLAERCHAAGVRLHHRQTDREGPLDPTEVAACLKPGSSVWFCGPAAWGAALAQTLTGNGLPREAFHREIFEFR
ncbi:MAG TPA: ferric reductase, partial [Azonexus sp.]|nr:ferric reductase [Azonexus sp.]